MLSEEEPIVIKKVSLACPHCGTKVKAYLDEKDLDASGSRPKSRNFRKYCTTCQRNFGRSFGLDHVALRPPHPGDGGSAIAGRGLAHLYN